MSSSVTPRKLRSQGPAEDIDIDNPNGKVVYGEHSRFDVEQEMAFYSSYHSNKVNKAIHLICIPLIVWSKLLLMSYVKLPGSQPIVLGKYFAFEPSLSLLVVIGYVLYYFALEPFAALTFLPLASLIYLNTTYVAAFPPEWVGPWRINSDGSPTSVWFGTILTTFGWLAQFVGHGVFEKRAPALTSNLTQALVLAPFFVYLEILFALFDYKPELHRKVKNLAGIRLRDMRRADKEKIRGSQDPRKVD